MAADGGMEGARCVCERLRGLLGAWKRPIAKPSGITGRIGTCNMLEKPTEGSDHPGCSDQTVSSCDFLSNSFIWLSLPVCQSGSSFNAQGWQLFKSAPKQKHQELSLKVPKDKYHRMRSLESNTPQQLSHRESLMWKCQRVPVFLQKLLCVLALENYNKHL